MSEVIVALDYPEKSLALKLVDEIGSDLSWVKLGMQLFYREGPRFVEDLKKRDLKIFLDLKLHDIPNTVASALASLMDLGVDMTNVHCLGGKKMMMAAKEVSRERLSLIGVTQLTSSSEEQLKEEMSLDISLEESVISLASLAKESGLNGVVCSSFEAKNIKEKLGTNFQTVCPGIRFEEDSKDDQVRVATPSYAREQGVDFAVIGRSITKSENPKEKFLRAQLDLRGES